jgi:hypothetical protein
MVTVWWLKMETTSPEPPAVAADLWSPLHVRAPGPTSGADPGSIYGFIAMLCPLLTLASRGIMILTFEGCITDCPKSWSGLLAFAAARVLGITEVAALVWRLSQQRRCSSPRRVALCGLQSPSWTFLFPSSTSRCSMCSYRMYMYKPCSCTWNLVVPVLYILR